MKKLLRKYFTFLVCAFTVGNISTVKAQVYINEIMPANPSTYMDPTYNFSGWIELYNAGDEDVSISYWTLSDDADNLSKYKIPLSALNKIPAKGYFVIWCDHNDLSNKQTNFKLDCDGGELYLSDRNGLIASLTYPYAIQGTSYARATDGDGKWQTCLTPTFGTSNNTATFGDNRCPSPEFNKTGGLHSNLSYVRVTIPEGMTLRYTRDGTEPTEESLTSNTGLISVSGISTIRAKFFAPGYIPSSTVTHTYIPKTRQFTLPIVSIVTDPDYLFDNMIGIYVTGKNGITGNGSGNTPRNWNQDWARPANVEFISPESGETFLAQECDISIAGGWSRGWAEKSLVLNAEKKFDGYNRFNYPFFTSKPNIRLKHILLRNSGNDCTSQGGTMMKDATIQSLVANVVDVEYQAYQPVIHYLNGEYYGIINMRERNNKQYVYSNFGYDEEDIDLFEMHPVDGYVQLCGTKTTFTRLKTLSNNATNANTYKQIEELLDIDEFINYMSIELYINNWDWPQNNMKGFRNKDNGKFRFTIYDTEGGFNSPENNSFATFQSKQNYTFDGGKRAEIEMVTILLNLLKNQSFKRKFVDKFTLLTASAFAPERVNLFVDSIAANIRSEMAYHQPRWNSYGFEGGLNALKNFAARRPDYAINHLKNFMGLGNPQNIALSSSHPQGKIFVNEEPLIFDKFEGKLFPPLTLRAEVPAGYEFAGWKSISQINEVLFDYGTSWSYYDNGSLDEKNWNSPSYSSLSWGSGNSPIGYGKDAIKTVVGYGGNANNKNPTTYFRKTFTMDKAPSADAHYQLNMTIDDGAIVYINGTEVGRYLMKSGAVTYSTYATTYAAGNPDQTTMTIPASVLKQGTNLIAIEVHQNSGTSTDIYLDAQLTYSDNLVSEELYSEDTEIDLPTTGDFILRACYTPLPKDEDAPQKPVVRINEASAANSVFVNEYFKRDDWVELYNTADTAVNIAGMYLSDNPNKLTKYQFPSNNPQLTTIPPYGYKIVWCDKLEDLTQLHASFKLAAEGGQVFLSATDDDDNLLWTDTLTYIEHGGDVSMGRYPDGADDIYLFNRPSIGKSNIYSQYNESLENIWATGIPEPGEDNSSGNHSTLFYSRGEQALRIKDTDNQQQPIQLDICNSLGQRVLMQRPVQSGTSISVSHLPVGWYVATLLHANGQREVCKFIK